MFFHAYKLITARWSHLRPICSLNITNSSQFDGQVHWPVMSVKISSQVDALQSHHFHLKTTQALKHVRQAQEKAPGKADQ